MKVEFLPKAWTSHQNNCQVVVIVSTQSLWHGGEEQAALLADGLRRSGHRCVILARRGGLFAQRMVDSGFEVHSFLHRGWLPTGLWQIRRALHRIRPDVLHYNDPHSITSAGLASFGMRIPLRVASRRVDFQLKSAARYHRFCDLVVCVSRAVMDVCRDGGIPQQKLRLVHDGVDPNRMAGGDARKGRNSLGLRSHERLLISVGKLTDHKGHRFLLDAMPEIIRWHPEAVLAIAGDGELSEPLQVQAARLKLNDRVRFLGHRNDVPDLLAAAELMVVPSHMEGLCSSIIDAMLVGLPVVATRAGGIPDLLDCNTQCGACGRLVPPRDSMALAEAVVAALESPQQSKSYATSARRRALTNFTAQQMVQATLSSYHEFTGGPVRNREKVPA